MAEEEEIFCIHVRVEDQPCHDVTQCLMHLPDYLQLCGALQNLQRQQHERGSGLPCVFRNHRKSQSNSSITCCLKSQALLLPQLCSSIPLFFLSNLFLDSRQFTCHPRDTPELVTKQGSISARVCTPLKKLHLCKGNYSTQTDS